MQDELAEAVAKGVANKLAKGERIVSCDGFMPDTMPVSGNERTVFDRVPVRDIWFRTVGEVRRGLDGLMWATGACLGIDRRVWPGRTGALQAAILEFFREFRARDQAVAWLSNCVSSPAGPRDVFVPQEHRVIDAVPSDPSAVLGHADTPEMFRILLSSSGRSPMHWAVTCKNPLLHLRTISWVTGASPMAAGKRRRMVMTISHVMPGDPENRRLTNIGGYSASGTAYKTRPTLGPAVNGECVSKEMVSQMDFDLLSVGAITLCGGVAWIKGFGVSLEHGTGRIINTIDVRPTQLEAWLRLRRDEVGWMLLDLAGGASHRWKVEFLNRRFSDGTM